MSVKDKVGKMLYIDRVAAIILKEMSVLYKVSESTIMRKALNNYISSYQDLTQKDKDSVKGMLEY